MTRWLIELVGEQLDTEEYPRWFPDGDVFAVEVDGKHYLTGSAFDTFEDGGPVRAAAVDALKGMSATISLLWPSLIPPVVGSVLREHPGGRRDVWVFPEGCHIRSKCGAAIATGGVPSAPSKTQAQELLHAGQTSPHLREALDVWADKYRSWGRLHRVLEEIERHLGKPVNQAGFCSANERERFTRSANCSEVAGIDARHASGKYEPPPQPMILSEAEEFVRKMLNSSIRACTASMR